MAEARLSALYVSFALFHDRSPPRGARDRKIALFHGRSPPSRRVVFVSLYMGHGLLPGSIGQNMGVINRTNVMIIELTVVRVVKINKRYVF